MPTRQPYAQTGDQIAVVSQSGPTITFFDATDHRILSVLEVPSEPHELCFDPDHRVVYCSHTYFEGFYDGNTGRHHLLTVVDADTHEVVDTIDVSPEHGPHGFALDRSRSLLYVSLESGPAGPGGVLVLDTNTRTILGRVDSEAPGPHWYLIDPDGARGYASNKEAGFVSVLDLNTRTLVDKWPVPGSEGIAISPDGSTLAVAAPKANLGRLAAAPGVRLFDTSTGELVRVLATDDVVVPLNWTVDGVLLAGMVGTPTPDNADENGVINPFAMTDPPPGQLLVWTGNTPREMELVGRAEVSAFPLTLLSSPDGKVAYVSAIAGSVLSVIDISVPDRPVVLDSIAIPHLLAAGAHGLAYIPVPA